MPKKQEENILTRAGCKNTKSRQAVIDILENADSPLSAEDIFLQIKEHGASTNLSTVYRILELMESKKLVEKSLIGEGKARYRITVDGHYHHIVCTSCRKTVPIDICPLEEIEDHVGKKTNYDITGHKLELYGLCPECKEK